jgi:hypothetical protein
LTDFASVLSFVYDKFSKEFHMMRATNAIERAFYDITVATGVLGRVAKIGPSDPVRALKEAKELRAKLTAFEAICRAEITVNRTANVAKRAADRAYTKNQRDYLKRNPHEIERAKALGIYEEPAAKLAVVETGVVDPNYVADGLVAMVQAMQADEVAVVGVKGIRRLFPFKKAA